MDDRLCPVDSTVLRHLERSGVQVDACPTCRGIWLDRGELDKILEQESANMEDFEREIRGSGSRDRDERSSEHGYGKKKKRSSILGEFLDFG
jgi:Zn-finger nucleic acid-binding protein